MIFEICAIIAVLIFALIAFFLIKVLISLKLSLHIVNASIIEIDKRISKADSLLNTISTIGDICENESQRLKIKYLEKEESKHKTEDCSQELAEWLVLSLKLGRELFTRR